MTQRTEKEGGKEAERWINPGIVGAGPGTLWCGFLSPALHLCGLPKSLLMRGWREKTMRPSRVTDRSQISSQADPQRWETGQAGDELVWPSSAGVHV